MSDSECRGANWYALGERDALVFGLQPQIQVYAQRCGANVAQPDAEKQYMAGWIDGDRERAVRMLGGVCCPN